MISALILAAVIVAIAVLLGLLVHPLLFILAVLAVFVILGRRRPGPPMGPAV